MKLVLTDRERHALESFLENHGNCVDSTLTLEVSHGSSIGQSIKAACGCRASADITDYSVW